MELDGDVTIDMNAFNDEGTRSSYFQLGWVVHFLQNLLAWSVVVVSLLLVGTKKVVIDILFLMCLNCLPVGNEWYVQKHVPFGG